MRTWLIAIMYGFGPLLVLEVHHLREKQRARRRRWSEDRRALRALRAMQAPRSIP